MEGMRTRIRFKPILDRRFFGTWFAWPRSCCGPAPAIPQILVGQNARPPASVLGYSPRRNDRKRRPGSSLAGQGPRDGDAAGRDPGASPLVGQQRRIRPTDLAGTSLAE